MQRSWLMKKAVGLIFICFVYFHVFPIRIIVNINNIIINNIIVNLIIYNYDDYSYTISLITDIDLSLNFTIVILFLAGSTS